MWGRRARPVRRAKAAIRAMFESTMSRSTRIAGVSRRPSWVAIGRPTSGASGVGSGWRDAVMTLALFRREAAVEHEAAADGKRTLLTRQEQRALGDLARVRDPVDRRPGGLGGGDLRWFQAVVDFRLQERRASNSGAERIDADVVTDQ